MNADNTKKFFENLLLEITQHDGSAATEKFSGLREVDAKVREAKLVLRQIPGLTESLLEEFEKDDNFVANSRRVRLETLAHYCKSAIKFLNSGVVTQKKTIFRAPNLTRLTQIMPNLEPVIQSRWLEAQKCQHSECYLSAIILMGSILEALLLARSLSNPRTETARTSPFKTGILGH